ncbi:MAG: hypothetical protein AB7T49_11140 [Oligoflexales bacterium]
MALKDTVGKENHVYDFSAYEGCYQLTAGGDTSNDMSAFRDQEKVCIQQMAENRLNFLFETKKEVAQRFDGELSLNCEDETINKDKRKKCFRFEENTARGFTLELAESQEVMTIRLFSGTGRVKFYLHRVE